MKTAPIEGAAEGSAKLLRVSVALLALSIVCFAAILLHLAMTILAFGLFVGHRLLLKKSVEMKIIELACEDCGWASQT
ncbi:hypothetical protein GCM10025791_08260 [Halioxenophilus aromaticivorans]|uniref:Uncharacterized protein n=1 Tax=Halioxenophilus aromaticivorans TaxID=1306992 RepID=A0AAV3TYY5_9ALTE